MKIAINALSFKAGGGITYLKNLLPELSKKAAENHYFIFIPKSQNQLEDLGLSSNFHFLKVNIPQNVLLRFFYEELVLPFKLKKLKVNLLYCPGDIAPFLTKCRVILAIRNPNPYYRFRGSWSFKQKLKWPVLKFLTKLSSLKAQKIIFVSHHSRKVIGKQLKIPPQKTLTIYHGLNPSFLKKEGQNPPKSFSQKIKTLKPYFLSVSTINPHKNYEVLLQAFAQLPEKIKNGYNLVIAGRVARPEYFASLVKHKDSLGISKKVIFLKEVPYQLMPFLYQEASLFISPSLLETFGHPLVEAMASEVPIIAAKSSCIPEIIGQAGIFFDPCDSQELCQKIKFLLENPSLQEKLKALGKKRAREFSWEKTAQKTLKVFKKVYEKKT